MVSKSELLRRPVCVALPKCPDLRGMLGSDVAGLSFTGIIKRDVRGTGNTGGEFPWEGVSLFLLRGKENLLPNAAYALRRGGQGKG